MKLNHINDKNKNFGEDNNISYDKNKLINKYCNIPLHDSFKIESDIGIKGENNDDKNENQILKFTNDNTQFIQNSNDIYNKKLFSSNLYITILYIKGINHNEFYFGKILEKFTSYHPTSLIFVKYISLQLFCKNYFGINLNFKQLIAKEDFKKISKIVPLENDKYIFSKKNSTK